MIKRLLPLLYIALFTILALSCERDDLCPREQEGTPRLIIVFKDRINVNESKEVAQLQLREIGSNDFAPLNNDGALVLNDVDSIAIPLRTNSDLTSYNFFRTTTNGDINSDNIDFNYNRADEYINRACGFKINFNDLSATQTTESSGTPWIESVLVLEEDVTDNRTIHVEIRH